LAGADCALAGADCALAGADCALAGADCALAGADCALAGADCTSSTSTSPIKMLFKMDLVCTMRNYTLLGGSAAHLFGFERGKEVTAGQTQYPQLRFNVDVDYN
jgi:hypothetical protein